MWHLFRNRADLAGVDAPEAQASTESVDDAADTTGERSQDGGPGIVALAVLPCLVMLLTLGVAWLKWEETTIRHTNAAAAESIKAASESTVALLSYHPDTVEQELENARDRLTGDFRDAYTSLTNDVVIPGAKQQQISAVATVPAAASVSATDDRAVVVVFVNQSTIVGTDAPTETTSSVRVTLDQIEGRWLISDFTPI